MLLCVPNVSEGRDTAAIQAIAGAFAAGGAHVLDIHQDVDHNRSVVAGARVAVEAVDLRDHDGVHPRVGAIDVVPFVHRTSELRGAACAEALVAADLLGTEIGLPSILYGALGNGRTRAELRRGGPEALAQRLESGELRTDFGPPSPHPTAGVALVAARPPLVAFNVELAAGATLEQARGIAGLIRESGAEGRPGLRAIGLVLESRSVVQVSMNVERPDEVSLADAVAAVRAHAAVDAAELVGLAPEVALRDFPADVPLRGFDPERHILERALERTRSGTGG
jgi:glutamate formiminotransferase